MKMLQKKGLKKAVVMLLLTLMVSNLSVFAAEVGDALSLPESGWIRFDDRHANINYVGTWSQDVKYGGYYNNTYTVTSDDDSYVQFNFSGPKIRILGIVNPGFTDKGQVEIDGKVAGTFTQLRGAEGINHIINFEALNLEDKEHSVKITYVADANGYQYTLDSIDLAEGNTILPYDSSVEGPKAVLTITPDKSTIKVGEEVTTELAIDNITDIAAEDIRIAYDSEKLEYLGHEEVDGIKLVYNDVKNGELRFILASKGESNLITAKTALLKLKFKGIKTGEALADITKGRVSDGIEMEKDLTDEECDQTTITIEGLNDVNNSGEFTLLDLAIDARHLLKDPTLAELAGYNTDVVVNNAIDEDDLLEIGKYMLLNPNYTPNN